MIHIHSIPSPLKPKYITPPYETVTCVCADLTSLADIYYKLEWKYTSLGGITELYRPGFSKTLVLV